MTDIPAGIAAQAALTQQAIAIAVLKQAAQLQQQSMAALLDSVAQVPVSPTRGVSLNLSV